MKFNLCLVLVAVFANPMIPGPGDISVSDDPMPAAGGTVTAERPNVAIAPGCVLIWTGLVQLVDNDPWFDDVLVTPPLLAGGATMTFNVHGDPSNGIVGADGSSGNERDGKAELFVRWEYQIICDGVTSTKWAKSDEIQVGW